MIRPSLAAAVAVLAAAGSALAQSSAAASTSSSSSSCNGHAELCSRSYANVSYVGTHNSYSVSAGSIAANQNYDVTVQLNNGIRMLQNQAHNSSGAIHLCHSSCLLLDAGTITTYLTKVKTWMDANPNEVLTILWVNSDSVPVSQFAAVYKSLGLDTLSYTPTSTPVAYEAWPTLQTLISSGKRLVSFMDYGADYSQCKYILDHFTHFWETPYDQTNNAFPCTVDRGQASAKMYMINHYLDKNTTVFGQNVPVPDASAINQTNAASGTGSLGLDAAQCAAQHGIYPTFLLVDFYDQPNGAVFQVAAQLNGVPYTPVTMGGGKAAGTSSTSSKDNSGLSSAVVSGVAIALTVIAASLTLLA